MKCSIAMGCMAGVFVTMCGQAFADAVIENRVAADTPEKFQQVQADIRSDMGSGGRYEFIRPDEKAKVEDDLNIMASMLQKSGSVDAMSQTDKVRLFNTQENLNGILTHSDSNRLVCEHRAPVGTSIPRTTCQTLGEIERSRKATNKTMQDAALIGSVCANPGGCRSN